jgi:ABC-type transport system involved in multi-copper enzyme maturation permease subunit
MNRQLNQLIEMTRLELRVQRRNPIWMISLAAGVLMGYTEAFTSGTLDWPTTTQAYRAYQLVCVMIFGVMTFLLTAGSLARDLSDSCKDLLLSRPISPWVYIGGKYVGNVVLALGISLVLLAAFLVIPLFYGQSSTYPLKPFVTITLFSTLPTILFCAALAVFLMCLSRRIIIALPVFLVYFLGVAIFRLPMNFRTKQPDVDLWDFSMRLYPQNVSTQVGASTLRDMSFAHVLQPPVLDLYIRAALYGSLSVVLVAMAVLLLNRLRSH